MANIRARHTFHNLMAKDGKRPSLAQSMRDAGYSENYARNSHRIKHTKAWREETEGCFDNESLATSLKALLESYKLKCHVFPHVLGDDDIVELLNGMDAIVKRIDRSGRMIRVWYFAPDYGIRAQALDMIFRVQGQYRGVKVRENPLEKMTDTELMREIKRLKVGL